MSTKAMNERINQRSLCSVAVSRRYLFMGAIALTVDVVLSGAALAESSQRVFFQTS
jgi:hypothetical protein